MAKTAFPLSWHREGLANAKSHLSNMESRLVNAQRDVDRVRAAIALTESQIAEAERRGLDEFDAERFLVPRPRKTA
jgi:predicted  nucleic acid-binding Zn-ribbon protein